MLKDKKIAYASTRDHLFYHELWGKQTQETIERLGVKIAVPEFTHEESSPALWQDFLADSDAIITTWNSPCIDQSIVNVAPNLKIVGHAAGSLVGYVNDDTFANNIKVVSANSDMAHSVAEWCLMAGLVGRRHMVGHSKFGKDGYLDFPNRVDCLSIRNSVVGIWGFGAVARELVKMLKPLLPAKIQVVCTHIGDAEAKELGIEIIDFDTMVKSSDIIFCLEGLTDKTKGFFDKKALASLKNNMTLVNGGRAYFFNEEELIEELKLNRFNAVLDVFHEEPLAKDNALHSLDNVILTPHSAGFPSRFSYISTVLEDFERFYSEQPLKNEFKKEQLAFMTNNKIKG